MTKLPNNKEELINEMKMCLFCRDSFEYPFEEINAKLHKNYGMHQTYGSCWQPARGHKDYDEHLRWCKLLELKNV